MAIAKMLVSAAALAGAVMAFPTGGVNVERKVACAVKPPQPLYENGSGGVGVPEISEVIEIPSNKSKGGDGHVGGKGDFKGGDSILPGISYAPYRADHGCKTKDHITKDFEIMSGSYSYVRIYGTDCDQVPLIRKAAKDHDMKLFLGIWDINDVANEAKKIIEGINGDWDCVNTVSVGNELVNNGQATASQVVSAVRQARGILREAGYNGPVVAVDTFIAVKSHPELCEESDYCAINAHPFFDHTISCDEAGPWLKRTISDIEGHLSSKKRIVVTETGWPTKGMDNGKAIPGMSEQRRAIDSINKAFADKPEDLVLFSAFNDMWKEVNPATMNCDPYWGIGGAMSSSDQ